MLSKSISINGREIGPGCPVYVVAELSGNHNGELSTAVKLIKAARYAGADAIKLQTYTPDTLTIDCDQPWFRIGNGTIWEGRNLYALYSEAATPWEWHRHLAEVASSDGLDWFSTPFDLTAVDFLEEIGTPAYKIASFEIVDLRLIERVASTGKPIIMSTGMASTEEVSEAMHSAYSCGAGEVALLKCTSAYPAPVEEMHLRTIPDMSNRFRVPIGLSDHSLGISVPVASVALGACIVEKHLTLSRSVRGPDSAFSLEPEEFRAMVESIRLTERALGEVHFGPTDSETKSLVFRRSLFAVQDIKAGDAFTEANVQAIRPGYGLAPKHLREVLGRTASCDVARGTPLSWSHLNEGTTVS